MLFTTRLVFPLDLIAPIYVQIRGTNRLKLLYIFRAASGCLTATRFLLILLLLLLLLLFLLLFLIL